VDDRAGKSHPRLEHDPSLLGIDGDGATRAGQSAPLIEQLPHEARPISEVIGEPVVAARVPEIAARKPMAALRASPSDARLDIMRSHPFGVPNVSR
jgi:hypothetical protein